MAEEKECCCSHKTKERSEKEYKDMIHRLNRIEGQIRGIKGMVERDGYCTDILVQVAAVNACLLYTSSIHGYYLSSIWCLTWSSDMTLYIKR